MFVDTSVVVAIILNEPDAAGFAAVLETPQRKLSSPHVRLEAAMVLASRLDRTPRSVEDDIDALFDAAAVEIVPITDEIGRIAVEAFERFGKGRGRAQLNLADCLSYAVARTHGVPILFKGRDFTHTDLASAI